jgi:hypothetical protein
MMVKFVLDNSFVQRVREICPVGPIRIECVFFDDGGSDVCGKTGIVAVVHVLHGISVDGSTVTFDASVNVMRDDVAEVVLKDLGKQMMNWRVVGDDWVQKWGVG